MSDSEQEETAVFPADAEEALVESTEVDNPVEDADTAQMQTDENMNNDIDPNNDRAKEPADDEDENVDDLFGDEDEDVAPPKKRRLDDQELDSGDDMDRDDRMVEDEEPITPVQTEETMAEVSMPRHATLKGSDGETYLLQNAAYTGIEPIIFNPKTFAPPITNHHSKEAPTTNFSAAQTSASTIRWRRSPNDSSRMQSNSRIIRWSDGSLTLQIGSNALEQYELPARAMARPQLNPRKPTPTSKKAKKGTQPAVNKKQDAHTYLTTIDETQGFARLTNHVTAVLNVRSTKSVSTDDDAVLKLQMALSQTTAAKAGGAESGGLSLMKNIEDPDLIRKRAEAAEREKMKQDKMMQARREREQLRRQGAMGRSSTFGRSGGLGLSVAGLEDDGGMGYGAARKRAPPKKKVRRNDYSDEEEEGPGRGRTHEDEYDEEDDFIAPSDEEEAPDGGDDDDEEEEILEEDAEGEEDDAPVKQSVEKPDASGRRKGRQVVDDDDDE